MVNFFLGGGLRVVLIPLLTFSIEKYKLSPLKGSWTHAITPIVAMLVTRLLVSMPASTQRYTVISRTAPCQALLN